MTSNNAFAARTCIARVVVYGVVSPLSGILNSSNGSSGSSDLFDFGSSSRSHTFTISPTTSTTGRHLGFERDYNSHNAFRGVLRRYA